MRASRPALHNATMNGAPVVQLDEVRKRYGEVVAVDGVSLTVASGACFGLIGPNGAGKTSLLKMIVGLSPITSGTVRVFGLNVDTHRREVNRRLGVVPQEGSLDTAVTAFDNLVIYATYFGMPRRQARARADELLAFVQLGEKKHTEIGALSGGMVRRLVLARALMNDPELLVLDEPTTGLDPQARHLLWDRVRTLRSQGRSVLITTHYMDEAERLCDRIAVIDHGHVLAEDTPAALVDRFAGADVVEVAVGDEPGVVERLRALLEPAWTVEVHGCMVRGYGRDGVSVEALDHVPGVLSVTRRRANLEDVFLRLAGREIRE